MVAKTSPQRQAAFLRALAATGNQTIAAERARVSRSWVTLHARDPAFRDRMDAAIATARAKLAGADGIAPPAGWGSLDGEQLVVRGTNGRRVQVARAGPREFSPKLEKRFLSVLAATCNVKAACAEIGMTAAAVYAHRKRRSSFADRWDRAVETGYARLEAGLLDTACSLFSAETVTPDLDLGPATFGQAMQLLYLHRHRVRGIGKPMRRAAHPPIEEVHAQLLRRIEAAERGARIPGPEMEAARRDWAARRQE